MMLCFHWFQKPMKLSQKLIVLGSSGSAFVSGRLVGDGLLQAMEIRIEVGVDVSGGMTRETMPAASRAT
jgi:hypothetical protein